MLALLKSVLFRYMEAREQVFRCGEETYSCYEEVEEAFREGRLTSLPLKRAVAGLLAEFLAPLREYHATHQELYQAAYPTAATADDRKKEEGLPAAQLALGRVVEVADHPESKKHAVVRLAGPDGKEVVAVAGEKSAPELQEGALLAYVANCAPHPVKGITATAHLLAAASFSKQDGRRVCMLPSPSTPAPVLLRFGSGDAPGKDISLGEAGRAVKSLEVRDGKLHYKGLPAQPEVLVAIQSQIKI